MIKSGPIAADRLKSFVERIERVETEQKTQAENKRDIYSEAKGVGYDVKTLRKIVQIRKQDSAALDEAESLLDIYRHALGMETTNKVITIQPDEEEIDSRAAKLAREVDRCMVLSNDGSPPKIAAIMQALDCSSGKASKIRALCKMRQRDAISFSRPSETAVKNENETAEWTPPGEGEGTAEILPGPGGSLATNPPGNPALEGERDGRRNSRTGIDRPGEAAEQHGSGLGEAGLQSERQHGGGRDQSHDGGAGLEDGADPRPEQRSGGTRGVGGDHEHPDGQHVVRSGGDQGPVALQESCGEGNLGGVADSAPPVPRADATAPPQDPTPPPEARAVLPGDRPQSLYQRITGAFHDPKKDDGLEIPAFLRRVPA